MKLKTLAKQFGFKHEVEYFDYMVNSYYNGNFNQCEELFMTMTKADRKSFISYLQGCYDKPESKDVYNFYFKLL